MTFQQLTASGSKWRVAVFGAFRSSRLRSNRTRIKRRPRTERACLLRVVPCDCTRNCRLCEITVINVLFLSRATDIRCGPRRRAFFAAIPGKHTSTHIKTHTHIYIYDIQEREILPRDRTRVVYLAEYLIASNNHGVFDNGTVGGLAVDRSTRSMNR